MLILLLTACFPPSVTATTDPSSVAPQDADELRDTGHTPAAYAEHASALTPIRFDDTGHTPSAWPDPATAQAP